MNKLIHYSAITLATLILTTGCTPSAGGAKHADHHTKHWGYNGEVAPSHWGELDEKFHMCSEGKQQSPIDVIATTDSELAKLALSYKKDAKGLVNNGHTVQVNIVDGSTLTLGSDVYTLKQFHFHTPSENHLNGKSYPLEAHFVHATKDGKLAVVSVMFQEGSANSALNRIVKTFPLGLNKEQKIELSSDYINVMFPSDMSYYKFMGSLTTPPCSEQVKWFVMKAPMSASKDQIASMHTEIGQDNNRPIQPSNKRKIEE